MSWVAGAVLLSVLGVVIVCASASEGDKGTKARSDPLTPHNTMLEEMWDAVTGGDSFVPEKCKGCSCRFDGTKIDWKFDSVPHSWCTRDEFREFSLRKAAAACVRKGGD